MATRGIFDLIKEDIKRSEIENRIINYDEYMETKTIIKSGCDNFMDAMEFMIKNDSSIVSYVNIKKLSLFNADMLEIDKDGNYLYEYAIKNNGDIIDNISIILPKNTIVKFLIGGYEYDNIKTFINLNAPYSEFKLKFIFAEKPKTDDVIRIYYDSYILDGFERNKMRSIKKLRTKTNLYEDGMCSRL